MDNVFSINLYEKAPSSGFRDYLELRQDVVFTYCGGKATINYSTPNYLNGTFKVFSGTGPGGKIVGEFDLIGSNPTGASTAETGVAILSTGLKGEVIRFRWNEIMLDSGIHPSECYAVISGYKI